MCLRGCAGARVRAHPLFHLRIAHHKTLPVPLFFFSMSLPALKLAVLMRTPDARDARDVSMISVAVCVSLVAGLAGTVGCVLVTRARVCQMNGQDKLMTLPADLLFCSCALTVCPHGA